jgi:hypothetical protein
LLVRSTRRESRLLDAAWQPVAIHECGGFILQSWRKFAAYVLRRWRVWPPRASRWRRSACSFSPLAAGTPACFRSHAGVTPVATTATATHRDPVRVVFSNVHFHAGSGAILEVRRLEGALVSTVAGQPAVFDDQRSFVLEVDSGEIAISPAT